MDKPALANRFRIMSAAGVEAGLGSEGIKSPDDAIKEAMKAAGVVGPPEIHAVT